jgi:hypothetical protein
MAKNNVHNIEPMADFRFLFILFFFLKLEYFGEVFDSRLCRTSDTACDNCKRGAQVGLRHL